MSLSKLIRSKDRSNQTLREIAIECDTSVDNARLALTRRGFEYKRERINNDRWYAMAAEIVMTTAESIDSVCHRLELDPQKLMDRMYG